MSSNRVVEVILEALGAAYVPAQVAVPPLEGDLATPVPGEAMAAGQAAVQLLPAVRANASKEDVVERPAATTSAPDNDDDGDNDASNTPRMRLSEEERQWAIRIKQIITDTPELMLPPLSNMMIAQVALVSLWDGDDIEKATTRIQRLQAMRRNYQVEEESLESGKVAIRRLVQDIFPGHFLSFYFHPEKQSYVLTGDLRKANMSVFEDPDQTLLWLRGIYYLNHCLNAHLTAVRNGVSYVMECQGYNWKTPQMFQVKCFEVLTEMAFGYPQHHNSFHFFHTGNLLNLVVSAVKTFLPRRLTKTFRVGNVSGVWTLDELFLMPSEEIATQRLLNSLDQALELRYQNEASFTL